MPRADMGAGYGDQDLSDDGQNDNVGWMKTMTTRTYIRLILLGALVILSLAGFMIHTRIHLISQNPSFIVPFVAGIMSIAVVPALFWFKKTMAYGYVLNGFLCSGLSFLWLLHCRLSAVGCRLVSSRSLIPDARSLNPESCILNPCRSKRPIPQYPIPYLRTKQTK